MRARRANKTPLSDFAKTTIVKWLAICCALSYALVPSFVFCNCLGRAFASDDFDMCAMERQAHEPTCSRDCGCSRADEEDCCEEHCDVPACRGDVHEGRSRSDNDSKPCCDQFFKAFAQTSHSDDAFFFQVVKAFLPFVNSVDSFDTAFSSGSVAYRDVLKVPLRPRSLNILFCVFRI